jgi:hypothetical protein
MDLIEAAGEPLRAGHLMASNMETKQNPSDSMAKELMTEFARSTGLSPPGESPRRYLWTDAFAVCNFLELHRQTGDETYKKLALRLVDQVHWVLGRHRPDDPRTGWISGLDEGVGKAHPTWGGLRIGKELNERRPEDPADDRLEWDRDGQYYHYLTQWMHALNRMSRVTGDFSYNQWAVELAKAAHARFVYTPPSGGAKRMHWKMSVDLSRPLVPSMGQHDPLDGLITYHQLQAAVSEQANGASDLDLGSEIEEMAAICEGKTWATDDPLSLGGLLSDVYRLAQLMERGQDEHGVLLRVLLASSLMGLESCTSRNPFVHPADYRLAFRELGLSIGLQAAVMAEDLMKSDPDLFPQDLRSLMEGLGRYQTLKETIEAFWKEPANRAVPSWTAHRDINMVMLATSLAPKGYLVI